MKVDMFNKLLEKSPDGICLIKDYQFVDCNDALLSMLKYDSKDHLYESLPADFFPVLQPDLSLSSEKVKAMIDICINEGNHRFEWMHKKSDGVNFPIEVSLTKINIDDEVYVHALLKDITDKHSLKKTINEQNIELRQLVDGLNESAIVSRTDSKGYITFVNKKFCEISGYSEKELVGNSHNLIRHPEVEKDFFTNLWNTIKKKKTFKGIIRNRAKSGEDYYVDSTIIPILDSSGEINEYLSIRHDVTKLQQQNESMKEIVDSTIKRNEDQKLLLCQQSKMAAMGELISMITHQWRQPVTVISAIINKIEISRSLNTVTIESLEKDLEQIGQTTQYMSDTIDDFKNFFKPNKKENSIALSELIDQSLSLLGDMAYQHSIDIVKSYENIEPIKTYTNELLQVLLNILKNSIDALVMNEVREPKIFISLEKDNDGRQKIRIKDNGGGIEETALAKIFDPYFTTKDEKGTGLGLHISKMIIEEHCKGRLMLNNCDDGVECLIILEDKK